MGGSYTNYTLRGPSQSAATVAMAGRTCVVTPAQLGCVVVFDEVSEAQDRTQIANLASRLSRSLHCTVLALLNHDDDFLWFQLYVEGRLSDEYDSSPGFFDRSAEPSAPAGGHAQRLCEAFGAIGTGTVERVLRASSHDYEGYATATARHTALVRALGLPSIAVGRDFETMVRSKKPAGLRRITNASSEPAMAVNARVKGSLFAACLVTVAMCIGAKLFAAGWLMVIGIWLFPVLFLVHGTVQRYAIFGPAPPDSATTTALLLSNAFLLAAFLFQFDTGDDYGWLTITMFVGRLHGDRQSGAFALFQRDGDNILWDLCLFIPVVASWIYLLRVGWQTRKDASSERCIACGYQLVGTSQCPECGLAAGEPTGAAVREEIRESR